MRRPINNRIAVPMAVAMLLLSNPHIANATPELVTNGTFAAASTGWTAFQTQNPKASDSVEVHSSGVFGLPCFNAACVNAEVNANAFDTLTQTISGLTVGVNYVLTWAYSGRNGSGPQEMNVSFGGALLEHDFNSASNPWTVSAYNIVATSASEVLSFAAQNIGGGATVGNELTNVSLQAVVVPEPASLALLGAFALGTVLLRRKCG